MRGYKFEFDEKAFGILIDKFGFSKLRELTVKCSAMHVVKFYEIAGVIDEDTIDFPNLVKCNGKTYAFAIGDSANDSGDVMEVDYSAFGFGRWYPDEELTFENVADMLVWELDNYRRKVL